jgi:hypothetical protein
MRMLMQVKMPIEPFNSYVRDGSAGAKIRKILEAIKPEAAYFSAQDGHRGGIIVVNMDNASEIPSLAEPFFLIFNAEVYFDPCMTPEDLAKGGLDSMGQRWG